MGWQWSLGSVVTSGLLLTLPLWSRGWSDASGQVAARRVRQLVLVHLAMAMVAGLGLLLSGGEAWTAQFSSGLLASTWQIDPLTWLVMTLVATVGLSVCQFSQNYLEGEAQQATFYRWTGFILGAVSMLVMSRHFGVMVIAWMAVGIGLHPLLVYHRDNQKARQAAWLKFVTSRSGDALLIAASVLALSIFGTLDLTVWQQQLADGDRSVLTHPQLAAFAWLIVLGTMVKTVQVPFHSWLPETLEVPTPVSALMHAGIVNAGGYVLVRCSPLLTAVPSSLWVCFGFGLVTSLYGVVVMRCQPSIKRSLAYSTVAQMGFMVMQCGLGAFSAATVHLVAHSLYKAYAFLSSGELKVIPQVSIGGLRGRSVATGWGRRWATAGGTLAAAAWVAASFSLILYGLGIAPLDKPGGLLLGVVLAVALTGFLAAALSTRDLALSTSAAGAATLMIAAYVAAYGVVDVMIVGRSLTGLDGGPLTSVPIAWQVQAGIALAVVGLVAGVWLVARLSQPFARRLHVHAVNGFYFDLVPQMVRRAALG